MPPFLFIIFLINSQIHPLSTTNYYIQQWIQPNLLFPKSDYSMICSYNSTYSKDTITIFGGYNDGHTVYKFNISSNTFHPISDLLKNVYLDFNPNGAVTIYNNVYFSNGYGNDLNVNNFWIYDIAQNTLIQRGNNNPKPAANSYECYTTDYQQNIYLIGGYNGNSLIAATYIYNVNTQKWSDGPNLNIARHSSACIYNNGIIYVFGGDHGDGTIELYDTIKSNQYIQLKNVTLTNKNAQCINAFMVQNGNTIFIAGYENGFCNIYTINTQQISLCPGIDSNLFAWGHCGVIVENKPLARYYAFGIESNYAPTQLIEYAMIAPTAELNKDKNIN